MIKRFLCWIMGHKWKCLEIVPFVDSPYGLRTPSIFYTRKCLRCSRVKEDTIYGTKLGPNDKDLLSS